MESEHFATVATRWLLRGAIALAVSTFCIQWLLPRLRKWFRLYHWTGQSGLDTPLQRAGTDADGEAEKVRRKHLALRQELQEKHRIKAAGYRQRILDPREEAKKQKKEDDFFRFLGPAWKGKGKVLGTDESHTAQQEELNVFEQDLNPNEMSAVRRRIQQVTPQPPAPKQKVRRVVQLPEEPAADEPETVLVLLRSPVHTVFQRRFRHSDTVQTLLDFMTVSGFSQTYNTLCTSFPRHDVGKVKDTTLAQLDFRKRVTLNIEEKEL